MIEINLLPEELKKVKSQLALPTQQLWYILPAGIGLLVIIHLYFVAAVLIKNIQYNSLNKKWQSNRPSHEKVEDWKKQFDLASQNTQDIISLINQRVCLSDKLRIMSEVLPSGIWFNRLAVQEKSLLVEGSVVSLEGTHMNFLRDFLERLKQNKDFFTDFRRLDLGPVRMREFKGYQLMDFVLEGELR